MNTILVSALVLNGSKSGYRRILKNLLLYQARNAAKHKYIYVFQRSGWLSLGIEIPTESNFKVIIINDFKSKWIRGLFEQIAIPFIALRNRVDFIFMPATFGLLFAVKPTITFVHTNTHFAIDPGLRGRSKLQQYAHLLLTEITKSTSARLAFTSEQTYIEYKKHCNREIPKYILGNGLLRFDEYDDFKLPNNLIKNEFFLSVSQFYRLKNYDALIAAFIKFKNILGSAKRDFKLVVVGTIQEPDFYQELVEMCGERSDIIFMHDISDEVLGQLYFNARGYCFYSKFEGYSLTPGEALLAGINVALSDIPTHREIYRNLPFYADPNDIDSIAFSLTQLINPQCNQKELNEYTSIISTLSFDHFFDRLEGMFTELSDGCC